MKERPFFFFILSLVAFSGAIDDTNTTSAFRFTRLAQSNNALTVTPMILTWPIDQPSRDHCQSKSW
jgi:hypothetical protein